MRAFDPETGDEIARWRVPFRLVRRMAPDDYVRKPSEQTGAADEARSVKEKPLLV